jgi:hypothetical protein
MFLYLIRHDRFFLGPEHITYDTEYMSNCKASCLCFIPVGWQAGTAEALFQPVVMPITTIRWVGIRAILRGTQI